METVPASDIDCNSISYGLHILNAVIVCVSTHSVTSPPATLKWRSYLCSLPMMSLNWFCWTLTGSMNSCCSSSLSSQFDDSRSHNRYYSWKIKQQQCATAADSSLWSTANVTVHFLKSRDKNVVLASCSCIWHIANWISKCNVWTDHNVEEAVQMSEVWPD